MGSSNNFEIAVIGAGIAGIATAYYLAVEHERASIVLIDPRPPMSYTSAQSGDNYRNWWPHATMTAFANDSIDLLQLLADETNNIPCITQRGYVLATRRSDVEALRADLQPGVDVDVVSGRSRVPGKFPALSEEIECVLHVRKAGDFSSQQMGQFMLERIRAAGGKRLPGTVTAITTGTPFSLQVAVGSETRTIQADVIVNAAGPFAKRVAAMVDIELPVKNVYQQKLAFEDTLGAVPRDMPFSIDLDSKRLPWTEDERAVLEADADYAWLTEKMPGGVHCRPEGGLRGRWVKLGWAFNQRASNPQEDLANEPAIHPQFPEIVMRGAASLIPALAPYVDAPPTRYSHYGGYYTMTEENWPLIGPAGPPGSYMVAALSGFGSMMACAAGRLCAGWVCGAELPGYATNVSLARYQDAGLLAELQAASSKGLL